MNFSPYAGLQDPRRGSVVSPAQISARLQPLLGHAKAIRTFGATGGLECVPALAHALGFEVWAGAWISSDRGANERELASLIDIGKSGRARGLIVGSEVLLRGDLAADTMVGYLRRVRAAVPRAVHVTTAEPHATLLDHAGVLAASDVVFFNVHPYWEGAAIGDAVALVDRAWRRVAARARGKRVVISEVGWPSAGGAKGAAVASEKNLARFFSDLTRWANERSVEFFWFSATDEAWKAQVEGAVGAHWGLWYADGATLKPGVQEVLDALRPAR